MGRTEMNASKEAVCVTTKAEENFSQHGELRRVFPLCTARGKSPLWRGGAFVAVFHNALMLLLPVFPSRFVGWFR